MCLWLQFLGGVMCFHLNIFPNFTISMWSCIGFSHELDGGMWWVLEVGGLDYGTICLGGTHGKGDIAIDICVQLLILTYRKTFSSFFNLSFVIVFSPSFENCSRVWLFEM